MTHCCVTIFDRISRNVYSEQCFLPGILLTRMSDDQDGCEWVSVGIVELCAKIMQIMRNDFKDYARTFCQLCAPFSIQISINQERK